MVTEACTFNRTAVSFYGKPVTDYGLEVLRTVKIADAPPSLDVKVIRGKDEETVRINVVTLAARQKFATVLNATLLAGRPLSILNQRACDALRYKLHAELIRRPVEHIVTAPGPSRGAYHLPGITVTPTEDLPGRLDSEAFTTMEAEQIEVSAERLHLILLIGALLWRHAAGAKVARINIALEHSNLVNEAAGWYGQRPREAAGSVDFISVFGPTTAGGVHLHADGIRLAHLPPVVLIRPRDWFVHCVRCGLVGNYGIPEGHPIPAALISEGAGLLKFFGCKFDVRANLHDIQFGPTHLHARASKVSCEGNRRLYGVLAANDGTSAADTGVFAPSGIGIVIPRTCGSLVNSQLVGLFNDYALALWQANQWRMLSIDLTIDSSLMKTAKPARAAQMKYQGCMKRASAALTKINWTRRTMSEEDYRQSVRCVDSVFVKQADRGYQVPKIT